LLKRFGVLIACSAFLVTACGGGGGSSNRAPSTDVSPTHGPNDSQTVAVSSECAAAMKKFDQDVVQMQPDSVQMPDIDQTITACKSRAEWLTAVQPYTGGGLDSSIVPSGTDPSVTLNAFCNNGSDPSPGCH
jgi:hypothetical protein